MHVPPDLAADARRHRPRARSARAAAGRSRPGPLGGRAGLPARHRAGPGGPADVGRGVHHGRRPARVPRRGAAVGAADRGRGDGHRAGGGGRRENGGGARGDARRRSSGRGRTCARPSGRGGGHAGGHRGALRRAVPRRRPLGIVGRVPARRRAATAAGPRGIGDRGAAGDRRRPPRCGRRRGACRRRRSRHRPVPRPAAGASAGAAARPDDAGCRRRQCSAAPADPDPAAACPARSR